MKTYYKDAFDYADKLSFFETIWFRIGDSGEFEIRLWLVITTVLIVFFTIYTIYSILVAMVAGEETDDEDFLIDGNTVSIRSIIIFIVTIYTTVQFFGLVSPGKGWRTDVENRLNHSTQIEKVIKSNND